MWISVLSEAIRFIQRNPWRIHMEFNSEFKTNEIAISNRNLESNRIEIKSKTQIEISPVMLTCSFKIYNSYFIIDDLKFN